MFYKNPNSSIPASLIISFSQGGSKVRVIFASVTPCTSFTFSCTSIGRLSATGQFGAVSVMRTCATKSSSTRGGGLEGFQVCGFRVSGFRVQMRVNGPLAVANIINYFISLSSHYHISTSVHYHISTLSHQHITALAYYRISTVLNIVFLLYLIGKRIQFDLLNHREQSIATGRGKVFFQTYLVEEFCVGFNNFCG